MKAQICQICQGTGKYIAVKYRNPYEPYPFIFSQIEYYNKTTCHGCGGKGWIVVPDDIQIDFRKIT